MGSSKRGDVSLMHAGCRSSSFDMKLLLTFSVVLSYCVSTDKVVNFAVAASTSDVRAPLDNVITQWESVAVSEYAYLHLAQLEVLNLIRDKRINVDPTAAVAYASHFVVRTFRWERQGLLDLLLQTQLRLLNLTTPQRVKARLFGIRVALPIVRQRTGNDILEYRDRQPVPPNGPSGVYQFAPGQPFLLYGVSGGAPPVIAKKPEAYRSAVPGPPAVPSPVYNAALKEVRDYGSLNGSLRNDEQQMVLKFVSSLSLDVYTRFWAIIAKQVLPHNISLYDTAYVFAAMAASQQDGIASVFDLKWFHFFWRPITAIRQGDSQNAPVPDWIPATETAADPEYPSGATFGAASGKVALQDYLGTENATFSFTADIPGMGNVTRTYHSFSAFIQDVADFRIYTGNHFRFSVEDAFTLSEKIGQDIVKRMKAKYRPGM